MKKFVCWQPSAIAETVYIDIGGLPMALDPLFLAAHTPSRVKHLEGPAVSEASGGEQQIFDSLLTDIGTHQLNSIIAVVGTPGTGKSHAVRWISAHLREVDLPVHVLYVSREISNLKDLLRTLVAGLPGAVGEEMLTRVEHAIGSLTEAEVASRLTSAMAEELRWRFAPPSTGTTDESDVEREQREQRDRLLGEFDLKNQRRRNGFADILTTSDVKDHLEREGGTLRKIAATIVGQVKGGDSGVTKFEVEDLQARVNPKNRFVRQFLNSVLSDPEVALRLLQEALEQALPTFIGLTDASGETLETLFSDARRLLSDGKKELVLLFEDLAQFGLIDGALFNQFLVQPDDGIAPLRVVFAITNAKWEERVPEAVQRRMRHRYEVLPIQEVTVVDSVAIQPIRDFLARYLNLVRLGRNRTLDAWNSSRESDRQNGKWVPNSCTTRNDGKECQFMAECHRGFGRSSLEPIGEIGIYPFNEAALERLVKKMGSFAANPGRLLKTAIEEVLFEARSHIEAGSYPDKRVQELFDFSSAEGDAALRRGLTGPVGDRLLRTNIIWGNDSVLESVDILEAFDLPTAGFSNSTTDKGESGDETPLPPKEPVTGRKPLPLLVELNAWKQNPETLTETAISQLRPWLFTAVLERIEADQDLINLSKGIGKQLLESVFVPYSFVFPGAYGRQPAAGRIRFEVSPSDDMLATLVGLIWYQHHGHWDVQRGEYRWPGGYQTGQLRRHLETYLDTCAEEVRAEILRRRNGTLVRDHVLGLAVIARRCLNDASGSDKNLPAIGKWSEVEKAAREALVEVPPRDWLADLYAVRQGDSNQPQMIDAVGQEQVIMAALKSPETTLESIGQISDAFPQLKSAAQSLLGAIRLAAPDQRELLSVAESEVESFVCGADLEATVRYAWEVGDRARTSALFRPADGWGAFERACRRAIENAPSWIARQDSDEVFNAVLVQGWARGVVLLSQDLSVIREAINETIEFAKYDLAGGETAADLSEQISHLGNQALQCIDSIIGDTK